MITFLVLYYVYCFVGIWLIFHHMPTVDWSWKEYLLGFMIALVPVAGAIIASHGWWEFFDID